MSRRLDALLTRDQALGRTLDRLLTVIAPSVDAAAINYVGFTCCPVRYCSQCDVYYDRQNGYACQRCVTNMRCC